MLRLICESKFQFKNFFIINILYINTIMLTDAIQFYVLG
ncbi:hypothetical protein XBJ2_240008 [Xenorhabdus bovienii str. Jollieti]|uniref:Uncharacterized protein n=1 Tax=Xenorhabdus bovienii (strain SS-2004) TaxID=406818 RepID=D3UZE1_XENBS|nr:hypothetical protein XBJ1_0643 [Xenorhabdus bovienii SS-2004]CDH29333.1 hypothetical protein XBJ2_240008 [Xenorhabdus bovienii str. Jollieti]